MLVSYIRLYKHGSAEKKQLYSASVALRCGLSIGGLFSQSKGGKPYRLNTPATKLFVGTEFPVVSEPASSDISQPHN